MFSRREPLPGPSRAATRSRLAGSWSSRTGARPFAIAVIAIIIVMAACGPSVTVATPSPTATGIPPASQATGPSPSPTTHPDPATVYAAIEPEVVAIRGLQPKATVEPKLLDDAGL